MVTCALAVVPMGCEVVDEPDTSDDPPEQPATCAADDDRCDPYDQTNFIGTQATAVCTFLFHCCTGVERNDTLPLILGSDDALNQLLVVEPDLLSDELACVRALALAQGATLRDDVVALLDEDGARRVFDRDAAEVCIGQIEEAAELCAPPLLLLPQAQPEDCGRIFAPAVAEGGRCASDADCLDIDADGDPAPATCFALDGPNDDGFAVSLTGTCEPLPEAGEACAFEGGACAAGSFCSDALVCLPFAVETETCGERPCATGLRCLGTCQPLVASGQTLDNRCDFNADCLSNLCVTVPVELAPGQVALLGFCVDPPPIDPLAVRFDFCIDDRKNASLGDVIPDEP